MGNLRQRETLLQENNKLKKNQEEMNEKIDKVLSDVSKKMDKLTLALEEIKNKENVVVYRDGEKTVVNDTIKKNEYVPAPFIPSADTSGMKINVSTIEKKKRKTNLLDHVSKLSKMNKNEGVK